MEMTAQQMHDAVEEALKEIPAKLASGELNGSGRYFTDEELAAGAATGGKQLPASPKKADAA